MRGLAHLIKEVLRRLERLVMARANSGRDVLPDIPKDPVLVPAQGLSLNVRLDRDHPATDIHPHRVGHDRISCLDRGANGRTKAKMSVRHERQVSLYDRDATDRLCL